MTKICFGNLRKVYTSPSTLNFFLSDVPQRDHSQYLWSCFMFRDLQSFFKPKAIKVCFCLSDRSMPLFICVMRNFFISFWFIPVYPLNTFFNDRFLVLETWWVLLTIQVLWKLLTTLCGLADPKICKDVVIPALSSTAPHCLLRLHLYHGRLPIKHFRSSFFGQLDRAESCHAHGTLIRFFFGIFNALGNASCTSWPLPKPWPTMPLSFPTTTRAEKLKARPPLVVFTTRLMDTTFSFSYRSPALILDMFVVAMINIYKYYFNN